MLFEMVSGRPPFEADSAMTIMMMHLNDPVPDLNQIREDVPDALKSIIEKALAKDPQERYQTAGELAIALRNYLKVVPLPVVEAPTVQDTVPPEETYIEPVASPPPSSHTSGEASIIKAEPSPKKSSAAKPQGGVQIPRNVLFGGGALVVLVLLIFIFSQLGGDGEPSAGGPTETSAVVSQVQATETTVSVVDTAVPSETPRPTEIIPPTSTSPPTQIPTATVPPGFYVRINGISLDGSTYVVDYETFDYVETLPGMHVHFYFDTVPEEEAGVPGPGNWIIYGGPRPFKGYTIQAKPAGANQMCARVANADHSIIYDTGNCFDLPEA
jgi:serine/threonine protein kinase